MDYKQLTDADLLGLLKSGDHTAFNQLYDRTAPFVLTEAYNKLRNREDARDLVQDIYSKLWVNRETVNINSSLLGFLLTSFRHAFFNLNIHQKVKAEYLHALTLSDTGTYNETDHRIRANQIIECLEREILSLPKELREVFELARNHNMSYKDIAKTLGISVRTVVTRMNDTKYRLKKKFGGLICFLWTL